jgi:hypothetical protein
MGLFNNLMSSEPDEIKQLRAKIKAFEQGFEQRRDYDDLQNLSACQLQSAVLHPDDAKQTSAFMAGRNALEKAVAEANIETIQPAIIEQAIKVYEQKSKQMFMRPLYDLYSDGLKRFLERMANATIKQINREKMTLKGAIEAYTLLATHAGNLDSQWFHDAFVELEKKKSDSAHQATKGQVQRIYPNTGAPPPAAP